MRACGSSFGRFGLRPSYGNGAAGETRVARYGGVVTSSVSRVSFGPTHHALGGYRGTPPNPRPRFVLLRKDSLGQRARPFGPITASSALRGGRAAGTGRSESISTMG